MDMHTTTRPPTIQWAVTILPTRKHIDTTNAFKSQQLIQNQLYLKKKQICAHHTKNKTKPKQDSAHRNPKQTLKNRTDSHIGNQSRPAQQNNTNAKNNISFSIPRVRDNLASAHKTKQKQNAKNKSYGFQSRDLVSSRRAHAKQNVNTTQNVKHETQRKNIKRMLFNFENL